VELGCSAGLLLLPDRYGYDYDGHRAGRPDAPDALVMRCALRAGPPDGLDRRPPIAGRTGLDLRPIAADDPDGTDWLRSCVWPEHTDRAARLDAALAEARAVPPTLVAGDLLDTLPAALATAPGLPVVLTSHALAYLPGDAQRRLADLLAAAGRRGDLAVIVNESVTHGAGLFAALPDEPGPDTAPTVITWSGGRPAVEVLGRAEQHGAALHWQPTSHPYAARDPA
jgi:hypothetical protein